MLMVGFCVISSWSSRTLFAQHCGQFSTVLVWETSQVSWEFDDLASMTDKATGQGRIRNSDCDGPLCRSQLPDPLQSGNSLPVSFAFPWRCTGLFLSPQKTHRDRWIGIETRIVILNPDGSGLIRPPRLSS